VRIDQRDLAPGSREVVRGPRSEHARSDDDDSVHR
jgi:hypothetical protein